WPGRGDGTFGGGIESYSPNSYPWAGDVLAVADFNGDARLDVFTASRTGSWAQDYMPVVGDALLGLGDGTFDFEGSYQLGITWPTGIGTVGIGQADVAVAGHASDYSDGTDTFVVLFNDGNWPPPVPPPPPIPRIYINDVTLTEGNTGTRAATFTVTLSRASNA